MSDKKVLQRIFFFCLASSASQAVFCKRVIPFSSIAYRSGYGNIKSKKYYRQATHFYGAWKPVC